MLNAQLIDTFLKKLKKGLELYVSGIYPRIFIRINLSFKAGEGTLGFLTKTPTCTRFCGALRDVKAAAWKAAHGAAQLFHKSSQQDGSVIFATYEEGKS